MAIDRTTRLRDAASTGREARRILDRVGLDYCCEGGLSLGDACRAAQADVEALEQELKRVTPQSTPPQTEPDVRAVVDRVLGELHPVTKKLLTEAAAAAIAFAATAPSARPVADALGKLSFHATRQMREEEDVLFSRVRALADARMGRGPYPPPPFRTIHEHGERLREGHRQTHEYVRLVRALLPRVEGPGWEEVRARTEAALDALMEQLHLENNELLPRATELEPNGYSAHA